MHISLSGNNPETEDCDAEADELQLGALICASLGSAEQAEECSISQKEDMKPKRTSFEFGVEKTGTGSLSPHIRSRHYKNINIHGNVRLYHADNQISVTLIRYF